MKLFKGQKVHIRATVVNPEPDSDDEIEIQCEGMTYNDYVKPHGIIHAEPAPYAVGDLVTWGAGGSNYIIIHIDDGVAFLKYDGPVREHTTREVSDLRLAG